MPSRKNILITGATGFVGSHLAYRLLESGHHVTALARGGKNASARDRILGILKQVPTEAGQFDVHASRLDVIEGDIAQPRLGMAEDAYRNAVAHTDEVWHCAASLSFSQEERDEIFRMNVGGTQHVLDLVSHTASPRLHHVSTAYVAGTKSFATESEINTGQRFRNAYEASKCEAEELVVSAHDTKLVNATVYRPSVVVGDSRTGRATHFHGIYAFIRGLYTVTARLRRNLPADAVVDLPMRLLASLDATLNFVPIEYVVDGMVHIGNLPESAGGAYHLANPHPTPNNRWWPIVCRGVGVKGIEFVEESAFERNPPTKLESLFQKQMAFYYMYLQGEPRFDCTRALDALRGSGIECPQFTPALCEKMLGWWMGQLKNG